jgi:hypothetical protein
VGSNGGDGGAAPHYNEDGLAGPQTEAAIAAASGIGAAAVGGPVPLSEAAP